MIKDENVDRWIDEFSTNEITAEELACLVRLIDRDIMLRMDCRLDHELENYLFDAGTLDLMIKLKGVKEKIKRGRKRRQVFLMAAALLVLALTGAGFWFIRSGAVLHSLTSKTNSEMAFNPKSKLKASLATDTLQENGSNARSQPGNQDAPEFRPNPDLEALVGLNMRAHQFRLISPEIRSELKAGDLLTFHWMNGGMRDAMELEVFNRNGEVILAKGIDDTSGFILSTGGWIAGRYYWKLLMDDNLVKAGVFVVH